MLAQGAFRGLVWSDHPFAREVLADVPVLIAPASPKEKRAHLQRVLAERDISRVCADVFPAGRVGELRGLRLPEGRLDLLARRLRPERWADQEGGPPLGTVWVTEALDLAQIAWLRSLGGHLRPLQWVEPMGQREGGGNVLAGLRRPVWAVIHTGPPAEVDTLVAHAEDEAWVLGVQPSFVLVHPTATRPGWTSIRTWNAATVVQVVDRVVGGGGANLVREIREAGVDAVLLPFPRQWDDQAARIRAFRLGRSRAEETYNDPIPGR